ncbi:MAG: DUF4347 domain-containing protein [Prolixibacteraceae bacterium]|nr:DUF4347 domain-containing protein [Prolixibacteraceae bacterium]
MNNKPFTYQLKLAFIGLCIVLVLFVICVDKNIRFTSKNKEIIFISSSVIRTEEFESHLPHYAEIVYLSKNRSGIEQITETLARREEIDAVRIISHGNAGFFTLNGEVFNHRFVAENSEAIASWKEALADDADIMLYGCKFAASAEGRKLVKKLAELTGADIAAATEEIGGMLANWTLDYKVGEIGTATLKMKGYEFHLATLTVTSNADGGAGSLRQAITDAVGGDEIVFNLSEGNETITLSLGDINIGKNLTIDGDNSEGSGTDITISGNWSYRILNITVATVTLQNLTLENGDCTPLGEGGGIKNTGNLTLNSVDITGCTAYVGGGIYNEGDLTLSDCIISGNISTDGPGGGIYHYNGDLSVANSEIKNNVSPHDGGGISNYAGTITSISNSTISGNTCDRQGGGIFNAWGELTSIDKSTICNNSAGYYGGGMFSYYQYTPQISNTTICGNTANYMGGGICTVYSDINIENSTISGNHSNSNDLGIEGAEDGGGIYFFDGIFTFKNTLIAGNYKGSGTSTGDDYFYVGGTLTDNGHNVVWYSNVAANATGGFNDKNDILYNTKYYDAGLSYTSWSRNGAVLDNQNLNLSSTLADNGGPTQTLAVTSGSFAISAGSWDSKITVDQRGENRREVNPTIGAFEYIFSDITWTGATSTAWETTSNWNPPALPTSSDDLTIPDVTNQPEVNSTDAICNNLTIDTDAMLTVKPARALTVGGDLVNNADTLGLVLESDATGTGNLANNSTGVGATVEQFFVEDQWHYVTTPVTGHIEVERSLNHFYVIGHTEVTDAWNYLQTGNTLTSTTGYGAQYYWPAGNDTTLKFFGILNTGNQTFNTAFTDHDTHGWNLTGNPYPCTIDWETGITLTGVDDAIYLWDPVAESYTSYVSGVGSPVTQTGYIAPNQGFFVRANAPGGSVAFTDASKTTTSQAAFKSVSEKNIIRLTLSDFAGRADETVISINPLATSGFDARFDASKLKAVTSLTPQLSIVYQGGEYSINSLSELLDDMVIQLEMLIKQKGTHTLSLNGLKEYSGSLPVYLYDAVNDIYTDLAISDYTFEAVEGELKTFWLAFGISSNTPDVLPESSVTLSVNQQQLILDGMKNIPGRAMISNLTGQIIYTRKVKTDRLVIPLSRPGVYLVKVVQDNNQVFTGKIYANF